MRSTRRSLFTLAIVWFLALAFAGSAAAQVVDSTAATIRPATAAVTDVAAAAGTTMGYSTLKVTWTVPANYRATCTDDTGELGCAAEADETPLTGFVVYYSEKSFASIQDTGVMQADVGATAATSTTKPGVGEKTLTGLDADTLYYVRVAAKNAAGTGAVSPEGASPAATGSTGKAPTPDSVTGVMVKPGNKELMVSWTAPHPGGNDRATVKISMYELQYQTSETTTAAAGEWMPTTPMKVEGDMTMATVKDLTNDVMYNVRVRAVNTADGKGGWSRQTDDSDGTPSADATPTPALPLFGVLALGAGLVGAGRRRLRRRQPLLMR